MFSPYLPEKLNIGIIHFQLQNNLQMSVILINILQKPFNKKFKYCKINWNTTNIIWKYLYTYENHNVSIVYYAIHIMWHIRLLMAIYL